MRHQNQTKRFMRRNKFKIVTAVVLNYVIGDHKRKYGTFHKTFPSNAKLILNGSTIDEAVKSIYQGIMAKV